MDETRVGRVKRTLTFLSKRTDTEREPYTAIVDEACAVRGDLERAAAFVETVGIDRLEAAIEAAFEKSLHDIRLRLEALLALPLDELAPARLTAALSDIQNRLREP